MNRTAGTDADRPPVTRGLSFATAIFLAALSVLSFAASQAGARAATPATGFAEPYAGVPKYEKYAPTEATSASQVNRPLGSKSADRIAGMLGLNSRDDRRVSDEVSTGQQRRLARVRCVAALLLSCDRGSLLAAERATAHGVEILSAERRQDRLSSVWDENSRDSRSGRATASA